jgi:hypothetical protein
MLIISPTNEQQRPIPSISNEKSHRMNSYDNYARIRSSTDSITITLKRDKRILDFGFSISDRLYGTGVYVNKIRANGPAELEGTLIQCMRIYKVFPKEKRKKKRKFLLIYLGK